MVKRRSVERCKVPADDEEFDLEVNDDQDPMEVVTSAGFNPGGWEYLGPKFTGRHTYGVRLIRLGRIQDLTEAKAKADELGYRLLEGQAREAFEAKYPVPDSRDPSPIIFGGSEWRTPDGNGHVASLGKYGDAWESHLDLDDLGWDRRFRWAVVRK